MKANRYLYLLLVALTLVSCRSKQEFVYFHDMDPLDSYDIASRKEPVIQPNDRLYITVDCPQHPELAIPFKVQQGSYQMDGEGHITIQQSNGTAENTYLVNEDGYVKVPVIGLTKVSGMSLEAAENVLTEAIKNTQLIKSPIVQVSFVGLRYTVLGAISGKGVKVAPSDRFTLLEAIAEAGDLSSNARLDRVCVIREENGQRKMYYNDIRTKEFFDSPCYYLQQNDIVYVEPKKKEKDTRGHVLQYISLVLSALSTTATILWWTNR